MRVCVEVQYERPVGWQLERGRVRGGALRRWGCVSRPCHGTTVRPPAITHDGTEVRLRLEGGKEAVRPRGDGRRSTPDVRWLFPGSRQRASGVRRRGGRAHPEGVRGPAPPARGRRAARHQGGAAAGGVGEYPCDRRRAQGEHPRDPPRSGRRPRGPALHRDGASPRVPLHRPTRGGGRRMQIGVCFASLPRGDRTAAGHHTRWNRGEIVVRRR